MDNGKTRKVINKLSLLVDVCIVDDDDIMKAKWNEAIGHHWSGMVKL